jgi:hypothetical protein
MKQKADLPRSHPYGRTQKGQDMLKPGRDNYRVIQSVSDVSFCHRDGTSLTHRYFVFLVFPAADDILSWNVTGCINFDCFPLEGL